MGPDKHITITIGGKTYPMVIKQTEEALIRKVEKEIQQSILEFQKAYAGLTIQDCLAMALITKGTELHTCEEELADIKNRLTRWSEILSPL